MSTNTMTVKYLHLSSGDALPVIDHLSPFMAIVLVEEDVEEMWQWEVCRWLAASGARFVLTWGRDAAGWSEAVDEAASELHDYEDVADELAVMTTAHEDEDMEEVFWYARHRAVHRALQLGTTLIIDVTDDSREDDVRALYQES
jgi:hypothetical protein